MRRTLQRHARGLAMASLAAGAVSLSGCHRAGSSLGPHVDRFRDVTDASGLGTFRHTDGSSGRKYFVEQIGSGVAIFDYDGDGWQDVYFCTGQPLPGDHSPPASNRLFRNRRDGTFEDVTARAGVGCGRYTIGAAAGDYNNDGHVDLYLTCFGENVLYRNRGDGTFEDTTRAAGVGDPRLSSSAAWGDYDGDGFLDLYVANYVQYRRDHDMWCSKFPGQKSYCGPNVYPPEYHTLYHNRRDGTFEDVSVRSGIRAERGNGLAVLWLDYDGDGRQDLFVANDQVPNFLWHNNDGRTFTNTALDCGVAFGEDGRARAGMGIDVADYDHDGLEDLVVTTFTEEPRSLYHNEGGRYRDVAMASGVGPATLRYLGFGTGFLDYDRDGWPDLFFANGHVMDDIAKYSDGTTWAQPLQLFRNRQNGTFQDVSRDTGVGVGSHVARGAAFGDLRNRGRTDIVVSVLRGKPIYLDNDCAPDAHWIELDLRSGHGNPQAIGARVRVTAGGFTQTRDVRANASYASSNDPRLLFGLGSADRVQRIEVLWPDGRNTSIERAAVDRILTIHEP